MTSGSLLVVVQTPREEHDAVLTSVFRPLIEELAVSSPLDAAHFDRRNKPQWGLGLHVHGASAWLEATGRRTIERRLEPLGAPFAYLDDEAEDKWLGGPRERRELRTFHHADSAACLDVLAEEAAGGLATSRAQWSLCVVEGFLDMFGLEGEDRLEFYRRGWQWASDLGRWDAEVFEALERKYEAQEAAVRAVVLATARLRPAEAWGGRDAARIATSLFEHVAAPIAALRRADGPLVRSPLEWAVLASHAHTNRLGVHAPQEATLRYLVWRARGGRRPKAS